MAKTVLALGMFDGMHLGHKKLIDTAVLLAKHNKLQPACFTFSNHPQELFGGKVARLITNEERAKIMKRLGVERIEEVEFTREIAGLSPERFLDMLRDRFDPQIIVAGYNYTFGKGKKGNAELLSKLAPKKDVGVAIVPAVTVGKQPVSSTRIRELLEKGDVSSVQLLLGRTYTLEGTVVEDRRIGRTIGFPTANIEPDLSRAIPMDGVYVSMAELGGEVLPAVTNIGTNPTVGGTERTIETNIFDFDGDIYGKELRVHFVKRLRPVMTFAGLDELKAQIAKDSAQARKYLGC
ncbi:MAG: bifunctional riboflavin kinase/FAD synthetase [Clostridia bacterium]|nr:bifunctional riboflavin kinase/FAD synthetase [Clostridia bacterium]